MATINVSQDLKDLIQDYAQNHNLTEEEYLIKVLRTVRFFQREWEDGGTLDDAEPPEEAMPEDMTYMERLALEDRKGRASPLKEVVSGYPTHYLVIRSPYAQQILNGTKKFEYRPEGSAKAIQNKTLAIAVSKGPDSPEAGFIIGQATFGPMEDEGDRMSIPVLSYQLWERSQWIPSPGGLGVRPLK